MTTSKFVAVALVAVLSVPIAAGAMTARPIKKPPKVHKIINSRRPGSPGFTGSSPLGSAQKADIKAKKKAAKAAAKPA